MNLQPFDQVKMINAEFWGWHEKELTETSSEESVGRNPDIYSFHVKGEMFSYSLQLLTFPWGGWASCEWRLYLKIKRCLKNVWEQNRISESFYIAQNLTYNIKCKCSLCLHASSSGSMDHSSSWTKHDDSPTTSYLIQSKRAREHGADVCHASLVMQVMCVWTVKKCHGFMWKQTLVASDRKSRHPLHPPTSDSWLLCPWVTVGTHHCWPHGPCHFCDSLTVITWRRRKAKHRAQKMKHVMAVSDVIKPDKRQKKKHPVKHEKIMQELEDGAERDSL